MIAKPKINRWIILNSVLRRQMFRSEAANVESGAAQSLTCQMIRQDTTTYRAGDT
jgi:hypothetical protein